MPTARTRKPRSRQTAPLDQTEAEFLLTGERPIEGTPGWRLYVSRHFDAGKRIKQTWRDNRRLLLAQWKKQNRPGQPWGVRFDAKRSPK